MVENLDIVYQIELIQSQDIWRSEKKRIPCYIPMVARCLILDKNIRESLVRGARIATQSSSTAAYKVSEVVIACFHIFEIQSSQFTTVFNERAVWAVENCDKLLHKSPKWQGMRKMIFI